jgi:subtilisin-like proprotein convertase family protein
MKKLLLASVLSITVVGKAQVLLTESFEGSSFPPAGWSIFNNGTGNDWVLNDQITYFYSTSDGAQSMVYEYSSTDPADAWAFTPDLALASGDSIVLEFDYAVASDFYPESMKVTLGQGQNVAAQTTTLWDSVALINTDFITATIGVKITSAGTYNFAFNCYSIADQYAMIVDKVSIRKVLASDIRLNAYTGLLRSCSFGTGEPVSLTFENIGSSDLINVPLAYTINNGAVVSENAAALLTAGTTGTYTFTAGADFSAPGSYQVKIFNQGTDGDRSNDTLSFTITSDPVGMMVKTSIDTVMIPDNDSIISTLPFCGINTGLGTDIWINKVEIHGINHTYADDIDLLLISPGADTLVLSADNGDSYANYPDVIFTDSAMTYISDFDFDSLLAGYYHTQDTIGFAKFNGQDPNGTWQLKLIDDADADIGYLTHWTLEFTTTPPVSLKEQKAGDNFISVFPNPNKGVFTLRSKSGSAVSGSICSMSGAEVGQFSMERGTQSQTMDLRGLAGGMYYVKAISDNGVQTVKLIIE